MNIQQPLLSHADDEPMTTMLWPLRIIGLSPSQPTVLDFVHRGTFGLLALYFIVFYSLYNVILLGRSFFIESLFPLILVVAGASVALRHLNTMLHNQRLFRHLSIALGGFHQQSLLLFAMCACVCATIVSLTMIQSIEKGYLLHKTITTFGVSTSVAYLLVVLAELSNFAWFILTAVAMWLLWTLGVSAMRRSQTVRRILSDDEDGTAGDAVAIRFINTLARDDAHLRPSLAVSISLASPLALFFFFDFLVSWLELLRNRVSTRTVQPIVEDLIVVVLLMLPCCIATLANDRLRIVAQSWFIARVAALSDGRAVLEPATTRDQSLDLAKRVLKAAKASTARARFLGAEIRFSELFSLLSGIFLVTLWNELSER